jgi:hypothetical protein
MLLLASLSCGGGGGSGGTSTGGIAAGSGGTSTGGVAAGSGGIPATSSGGVTGTGGVPSGGAGGASAGGAGGGPACPSLPAAPIAAGSIIQFNDNGGWTWFSDERAVVDATAGRVVVGSVASGGSRDGDIDAVVYDLASGNKTRATLGNLKTANVGNDHDAPAFAVGGDGTVVAAFTDRASCSSYYASFDGSAWTTPATLFDWTTVGCPWDVYKVTFANLLTLAADNAIYAAANSVYVGSAMLVSHDAGKSFGSYGSLAFPATDLPSYYKYWSNGNDRIDVVASDGNPRDLDNSLWHGYFQGGALHDSTGNVPAAGQFAPRITTLTPAVATGSTVGPVKLRHLWIHDITGYADGTIAITGQGHVDGSSQTAPDLRAIYARLKGGAWHVTYLGKTGPGLDPSDQDDTGLTALDPDNPHVLFFSTSVDPRDDTTQLGKHELFMGVTCDDGVTWSWAPLTQGSSVDNIRPVVPRWDGSHTLLLWLQGTYSSQESYDLQVVGATAPAF